MPDQKPINLKLLDRNSLYFVELLLKFRPTTAAAMRREQVQDVLGQAASRLCAAEQPSDECLLGASQVVEVEGVEAGQVAEVEALYEMMSVKARF